MILSHYGNHAGLAALRQRHSTSLKGTSLASLIRVCKSNGLNARPVRLELSELAALNLPCVLHWGMDHFVVLTKVTRDHVHLNDPAVGKRKLRIEEASREFTGVALEISPGSTFEKNEVKPTVSFRQLTGSILGLRRGLAQILLLSLALQAFVLVGPLITQGIMDHVLVSNDQNLLIVLVMGFALLQVLQMGIGMVRAWAGIVLSTQLSIQWNANVLMHALRLPKEFFEKRHLGDITSRMGSVGAIQGMITSSAIGIVLDGIMAVTTLAMMLRYNSLLFLISLAALAIYLAIRLLSFGVFKEANEKQLVLSAKQNTHLLETLRGITSIKVAGQEIQRHSTWVNLAIDTQNQAVRISRMGMVYGGINGIVFGIEKVLITYFGATLVMENQFSIGMLTAFLAYNEQFSSRVGSLIDTLIGFKMLRLHGERLADIVLTPPEEDFEQPEVASPENASISVRSLSFRYAEDEPWILKDLDFSVSDGESIAIIGASGCGKTTLVKLLLGLLKPIEGSIQIGGLDLNRVGARNLRPIMGAVMQDDQLFAGSVADNISFFDQCFDQARIEGAARLAAIHDEIAAMPMGYHSLIGDMGSSLSGGQKQRVILARALYRNPKLLILDEATSHLDVANERVVNDAVKAMKLTKVIIAHRPETIASADRVLIMEDGRIASSYRPGAVERAVIAV